MPTVNYKRAMITLGAVRAWNASHPQRLRRDGTPLQLARELADKFPGLVTGVEMEGPDVTVSVLRVPDAATQALLDAAFIDHTTNARRTPLFEAKAQKAAAIRSRSSDLRGGDRTEEAVLLDQVGAATTVTAVNTITDTR